MTAEYMWLFATPWQRLWARASKCHEIAATRTSGMERAKHERRAERAARRAGLKS
jgi:hypothetical protein